MVDEGPIPKHMVEEWTKYIEPSRVTSFREVCTQASMQAIETAVKPFFTTWRTSLMGHDLERLRDLSKDKLLRSLVDTIVIEDDCEQLDPWLKSELPSLDPPYDIWPRSDTDMVLASQIGVADLTMMLREKLLCPRIIKLQNYRINRCNFDLCPEMSRVRDLVGNTTLVVRDSSAMGALARDVVQDTDLAVTFLAIRHTHRISSEPSVLSLPRFQESGGTLGNPRVSEAVLELLPDYQGQNVGFSLLRSAELDLTGEATSYWLEKAFYEATTLATLNLSLKAPSTSPSLNRARVVPKLTELYMLHATATGEEILSMLSSSRESLTHLRFLQVVLYGNITWRELLSFIAREHQRLTFFKLTILREKKGYGPAVDFRDVKVNMPEECQRGLEFVEKGSPHNKRISTLSYSGLEAAKVLGIIASLAKPGVPN